MATTTITRTFLESLNILAAEGDANAAESILLLALLKLSSGHFFIDRLVLKKCWNNEKSYNRWMNIFHGNF